MHDMTPVLAPLKLSAAGLRMAGQMIESNLRVAQVFGRAALATNPFCGKPLAKAAGPSARVMAKAESVPVKLVPTNAVPPKPAVPGRPVGTTPVKPQVQAPARASPAHKPAKRPRQPSPPPVMPPRTDNSRGDSTDDTGKTDA